MTAAERVSLPAQDPFTALSAHFGMLLGVSDLETVVGHPWAKQRLHNAWLHGAGVVWGFGVAVSDGQVQVAAGLCLDPAGHELPLPATYCVDLTAWRATQDTALGNDRNAPFAAHVIARFKACLSREVPALAAACDGSSAGTAYSRLSETTELCLRPGRWTAPADDFPRVRRFLHDPPPAPPTNPPADPPPAEGSDVAADVDRAWQRVRAAPPVDRAAVHLAAARLLAVFDGIDRRPAPDSIYAGADVDPTDPESAGGSVLLADLVGVRLTDGDPAATVEQVDYGARRQHVAGVVLPELIPPQPDGGTP